MEMIGFVYLWINKVNGKKYVGVHKGKEDDGYIGSGTWFKRAVAKYGIQTFERRILHREYNSVEALYRREFEIINELNAVFSSEYYNLSNFDPKFTQAADGVKMRIITDATREKIRQSHLGQKASESTKLKMSRKRKGKPSPTKGMTGLTSGSKNGNWGKVCYNNGVYNRFFVRGTQPEGWQEGILRKDMSGANNPFFGKKHADITIRRLSEQRTGKNIGSENPFWGKRHTSETKVKSGSKIKESWRRRKLQNENNQED